MSEYLIFHLPAQEVAARTPRTGTHRAQGLFVMAGPGIKAGYQLRASSILDISPTMLYLLGLPVADDMVGRVLREALEPSLWRSRPLQMVATFEHGPARAAPQADAFAPDEEQLRELRALGYIQ